MREQRHAVTMNMPTTLNATVSAFAALSLDSADDGSTEVQNTMSPTLIPPGSGAGSSMLGSIDLYAPISPLFLEFRNSKPMTRQENKKMENDVGSGSTSSSKGDSISRNVSHSKSDQQRKLRGLVSLTAGNEGRKRTARGELRALQWSALRRWGLNEMDTNSPSRRELGQDIRQAVVMGTKADAMETEAIAAGPRSQARETDTEFVTEQSLTLNEAWNGVPLMTILPIEGSNFLNQETTTASVAAHSILKEARDEKDDPKKKEVKQKKAITEKRLLQRPPIDKKTRTQRRIAMLRSRELQKKIKAAESMLSKIKTPESKAAEIKAAEEKKTTPPPPPPSSHTTRIKKKSVSEKNKAGKQRAKNKNITEREMAALSFLIEGLNVDGAAITEGSEETKT